MQNGELMLIAIGLAMDACAVAICKGMSIRHVTLRQTFLVAGYFGGFQALMPWIGYLLGMRFAQTARTLDHWIAFVLLGFIGLNMIRESREEQQKMDTAFGVCAMLPLAIATSIDALAVGVTFAFLDVTLGPALLIIGVTTFIISAVGVQIGHCVGSQIQAGAELIGGVVLILIAIKILVQHLGILGAPCFV